MKIVLREPTSPRYIYIPPNTNDVYLLVPLVSGIEISTDNTCKVNLELTKFFKHGAQKELNDYQIALEFDISILDRNDPIRLFKEKRLQYIKAYLSVIETLKENYEAPIKQLKQKDANLYSIQLCPIAQDNLSDVTNATFSISRRLKSKQEPRSALYFYMHQLFPDIRIAELNPRTILIQQVLEVLPKTASFTEIQQVLSLKCVELFQLDVDFTKNAQGEIITQTYINELMGIENTDSHQDYIESLLGCCALDIWVDVNVSPFQNIYNKDSINDKIEKLSIMVQFFIGNINVYCKAKNLSSVNFGGVLDHSKQLSEKLVRRIVNALNFRLDVENEIFAFINENYTQFQLKTTLSESFKAQVKNKFKSNYLTVTATNENPYMDDFMILDLEASEVKRLFFNHQGAICFNLLDILPEIFANQEMFLILRNNWTNQPVLLPHQNEVLVSTKEITADALLEEIDLYKFNYLPQIICENLINLPGFLPKLGNLFLDAVAKGQQDDAKKLLILVPEFELSLLQFSGHLKDNAGRQFNCTAFEYAYWAKDTLMCKMLLAHMSHETLNITRNNIMNIKLQGLKHFINGDIIASKHYDIQALINPLREISKKTNQRKQKLIYMSAIESLHVAQLNMPAHVAQAYCASNISFYPLPEFNNSSSSRQLNCYNSIAQTNTKWFQECDISNTSVLVRGDDDKACIIEGLNGFEDFWIDLEAIEKLDEVKMLEIEHLDIQLNISFSEQRKCITSNFSCQLT